MGISSSSLRDIIHKSEKRVSRKKKRYTRHRKKRRQNKTQKRKRTTEEILKEDYDFTDKDILFVNEFRENIGAPPPGKLKSNLSEKTLHKLISKEAMDNHLKDYNWSYKDKRKHRLAKTLNHYKSLHYY